MSTTRKTETAQSWSKNVIFEMRIPQGTSVAPIQFGQHDAEHEVLIRPNQDWRIIGMHSDKHDQPDGIDGQFYVVLEPIN